jgi:hypothetical protein
MVIGRKGTARSPSGVSSKCRPHRHWCEDLFTGTNLVSTSRAHDGCVKAAQENPRHRYPPRKMLKGRYDDTTQLGAFTTSLIFRSAATLHRT